MFDYSNIFSSSFCIFLVIVFFGGSIFVHELGHFLAAKARGMKVLRFSIGFGPKIFSKKGKDGCEYRISLLPFGGYVALPQLADMGELEGGKKDEQQNLPPAGCLDKIIVSMAGAFFNVLFAALLAGILWFTGIPSNAANESTLVGHVYEEIFDAENKSIQSPAFTAGILAGDEILAIDGIEVENFSHIIERIALGAGRDENGNPQADIKIKRGDKTLEIKVKPALVKTNVATGDEIRMIGISPKMTLLVSSVMENSPAMRAGIKEGDIIISANSELLHSVNSLSDKLDALPKGESVLLEILRKSESGEKKITLSAVPQKIARTKPCVKISTKDGSKIVLINSLPPDAPLEDIVSVASSGSLFVHSIETSNPMLDKMHSGDIVYAISDRKVSSLANLNTTINRAGALNIPIKLSLSEGGKSVKDVFLPPFSESEIVPAVMQNMLGCSFSSPLVRLHPSILKQFKDAWERTYGALTSLLNPKSDVGINSLAGPVDIGRVIYKLSMADLALVMSFAVLLNVNLAILNMLPIPVLDGGHIIFAIIAKIRGRPLRAETLAVIQGVFSLMFMALMVYIVYYGMMRWSGDSRMERAEINDSNIYIRNIDFEKHE